MPNADQYLSMPIKILELIGNTSQFRSLLIAIGTNNAILIGIGRHWALIMGVLLMLMARSISLF